MKDKSIIIKVVLFVAGGVCLAIAMLSIMFSFFKALVSSVPLPNTFIFFQGFFVVLIGSGALWFVDRVADKIEKVFGVEIVKKIILTVVLIASVYIPLFYS